MLDRDIISWQAPELGGHVCVFSLSVSLSLSPHSPSLSPPVFALSPSRTPPLATPLCARIRPESSLGRAIF